MRLLSIFTAAVTVILTGDLVHAAAIKRMTTSAENCAGTSVDEGGNYFCRAVGQVTYSNFPQSVSQYKDVTAMNMDTGECTFADKSISGPLAPLNEPVSLHFRGPIRLNQLAVYQPKTKVKRDNTLIQNAQAQLVHLEDAPKEKRQHPTIWVTATINGQVVSWVNDYWGPSAATPTPTVAQAVSSASAEGSVVTAAAQEPVPSPVTTTTSSPSPSASAAVDDSSDGAAGLGDYARVAYYNAANQQSQGLTFLGNYGGQGSGAWTPQFGNTLSYLNGNATAGAAGPTILSDALVPSSHEFSVFTDQPCGDDCGFVQPGSVAYKGFGGASKIFLFEFSMPHDNGAQGAQADMPALWMLNARIPHTSQYSSCSCWGTGCGEFDIFEVLNPGDNKCKSTLHAVQSGGDSNYFPRPSDAPIQVAVVFDADGNTLSVKVLDNGTDFGAALSGTQAGNLKTDRNIAKGLGSSLFQLG